MPHEDQHPASAMVPGTQIVQQPTTVPAVLEAQTASRLGSGHLHVALVDGQSSAVLMNAHAPLKLLVPAPRGPTVWAFVSTFGGGLVAGDHIDLTVRVEINATLAIGTQASTKVYRSDDNILAAQYLRAEVKSGALLGLLPDPVTCFTSSNYQQRQDIHLAQDASLLLIDPMTSGRNARAENWAFTRYANCTHITRAGQPLLHDAMHLHTTQHATLQERMGRFQALCTVVLLGPRCAQHAATLLQWHQAQQITRHTNLLVSASPLGDGAILRLAATGYDLLEQFLRLHLGPAARLFGDHWHRKP